MGEHAGNEDRDEEELLSRRHLAKLLLWDFLITLAWVIIAVAAYTVTEHATFLGLEGWQIRVTVTLLGFVPTVSLLLIGWDDVDALWMVVRTRHLERRQRYHALLGGEQDRPPTHEHALPPPDEETDTRV